MERIGESTPVAKKDHVCSYCDGVIKKGEGYERTFLKHDGRVYAWKNHFKCSAIASKLGMFDNCDEGVTKDDFYEYIKEEYADLKKEEMENKDSKMPSFHERLEFVINHHLGNQ
jgi:ribosomal protein L24E